MPIVDITVAYVNPPKGNARSGSIKDVNGIYYSVWPDKLDQFEVGGRCTIEYEEKQANNGNFYKTFNRIVHGEGYAAPSTSNTTNRVTSGAAKPDDTAIQIFVTGVIGRAHEGTGVVPSKEDVERMVRGLREGWKAGFDDTKPVNKVVSQDPAEALNDEVPF